MVNLLDMINLIGTQLPGKINRNFIPLKDFPSGCCRFTSTGLLILLLEKGFKNLRMVCRADNSGSSHCWIEHDNKWIYDLTITQYNISDSSFVRTIEDSFYKRFPNTIDVIENRKEIGPYSKYFYNIIKELW